METEKKSIKTINSYLSACREFWNYLERQGEIASDSNTPFNSKDVLPTKDQKKSLVEKIHLGQSLSKTK